ncbi:MAG: DNA cytosine methyltransferase, partial [FCB group bacterium]|nr:DNA cytosine methyltransferase [FCB group bacterium]
MKKQINNKELKAVDFFCSGGGMSYGLTMAGINVLAGIDIDISCKATYEANLPNSKFIHADIKKYSVKELGKAIEIRQNDDSMIFIGCSPCQYWTKINTIKAKSHKTKNLLEDFKRFVDFFNPGYIVIENVPGILSKKKESGLDAFLENLENRNYAVEFKVINFNYYGVPQSRKRFTLIATRIGNKKLFPMQETEYKPVVKDFIGENNGFYRIPAGHRDNTDFMHTASLLSEKNLQRIGLTPENGGNRLSWANSVLQLNTYKRLGNNSFKDVYGRMSWDKPAPT